MPGGFTPPRLFTAKPPDVAGTYGPAARQYAADQLEVELLPWQAWALDRILEHRSDGSLRWRIVVLTVSRQSGKSVLGRVGCSWRMGKGHEHFGEKQLVLSTANKQVTARELWQEAAYTMIAHNPDLRLRLAQGAEEMRIHHGAGGGRWLVQAATANLAVGLSVSMGLVDEAWNVDRQAVESGLVPTMLQRRSPQLWIVSTAGDSGSDLLHVYRTAALRQLEDPETAEILLLEWSAEPDAAIDDIDAWKAASPHWSEGREAYIRTQMGILPEQTFRTQLLNQKVDALGGWLTRAAWDGCRSPLEPRAGSSANRVHAAIEYAADGQSFAMVIGQRVEDRIVVRSWLMETIDQLWARVCELPRDALLLQSVGFRDRLPLAPCESKPVGLPELRLATRYAGRAITDQIVAHDGDPDLTAHVLAAVIAYSEQGPVLSMQRSPAPITLARALVWVLGSILEADQTTRPMVVSRAHS
jgi:phage terminase large subunit-like protein